MKDHVKTLFTLTLLLPSKRDSVHTKGGAIIKSKNTDTINTPSETCKEESFFIWKDETEKLELVASTGGISCGGNVLKPGAVVVEILSKAFLHACDFKESIYTILDFFFAVSVQRQTFFS